MRSDGSSGRTVAITYGARSRADERGSIADQIATCRAYAGGRGWEVHPKPFKDEAISAYSRSRGDGLREAKETAASLVEPGVDVVLLATETDRLARGDAKQAAHLLEHVLEATKAGYRIECVNEDIGGEMGLVLAALYGDRNHKDSKAKSAHVVRGQRRTALRGEPHGGFPAYGYRYGDWRRFENPEPRGLILVPEEADVVSRVFREWRSGKTQKAIGRDLNVDRIKPARAASWGQSTIGRMLRNPIYTGHQVVDGEFIKGSHVPIIPLEEWQEAQRLLAPPGSGKRSGRPAPGFLLRGLLICGICGGRLYVTNGKSREKGGGGYACYNRHKDPTACSRTEIPRSRLDEGVLLYFEQVCLDAEASWHAYRAQADGRIGETQALRHKAEQEAMRLQAQLDRADDDYGAGVLDAADYQRLRSKWSDEKAAAEAETERLSRHEAEIVQASSPDFAERLDRIREAVAARVLDARDDEGIDAVRAALASLFEGFIVYDAPAEPDSVAAYRIVPKLRQDVAGGQAGIPGRTVLHLPAEEEMYDMAEALSYRSPAELRPR